MASPLNTARTAIATAVELLTPPDETNVPYRHLDLDKNLPDGAGAHRYFWFRPDRGAEIQQWGSTAAQYRHDFELALYLSSTAYGIDQMFTAAINEAMLLARAINKRTASWGSGVDYVRCDAYRTEPTDSDDLVIVLTLRAETQESD